jgi:3-oxoacyl-[acyl-carrier-protein] synthase-3
MLPFSILGIEYSLGENKINISSLFENSERVSSITGIREVYETAKEAEDLAFFSAQKLLSKHNIDPDCLIYVTQSSKYELPGSSVLLQEKLGLKKTCGLFDLNAGCSGFAQALILASCLISNFKNILIICSDTYRKKLAKNDRSTRAVFSDGAASVLINNDPKIIIDKVISQSDGKSHHMLIQKRNESNSNENLHMSGRELWNFTRLNVVPDIKNAIKNFEDKNIDFKDIFIHQASKVVVDGIKSEVGGKYIFHENYSNRGNTVSSTIPILIKDKEYDCNNNNFIISGFGVGLLSFTLAIKKFK